VLSTIIGEGGLAAEPPTPLPQLNTNGIVIATPTKEGEATSWNSSHTQYVANHLRRKPGILNKTFNVVVETSHRSGEPCNQRNPEVGNFRYQYGKETIFTFHIFNNHYF